MYKRYNKKQDYSYCLGAYPTIELLLNKPQYAIEIIKHSSFGREQTKRRKTEPDGYDILLQLADSNKVPVTINDKLISKLSPKENCYVIGVFRKYETVLHPTSKHVILVNPSNSGNLGTILRTMLAFDVYDAAIIKPAVDIFSPQTVRSSMGSLFYLRFSMFSNIHHYLESCPNRHLYLMMTGGDNYLHQTQFADSYSVIFGNESSGLTAEYEKLGTKVTIDQSDKVDSLNLAVSVGITLHYLKNI